MSSPIWPHRHSPAEDAAVVAALAAALAPHGVALAADANRAWSYEAALEFAAALDAAAAAVNGSSAAASAPAPSAAGLLAYIEEPTADPADMAAFHTETGAPAPCMCWRSACVATRWVAGLWRQHACVHEHALFKLPCIAAAPAVLHAGIRVAVDESLDAGLLGPHGTRQHTSSSSSGGPLLELSPSSGLAAVVIKPSVLGGLEAAWRTAAWATQQGCKAVISSSFESSVGLAALAQLAAAVDAASSSVQQERQRQEQEAAAAAQIGRCCLNRGLADVAQACLKEPVTSKVRRRAGTAAARQLTGRRRTIAKHRAREGMRSTAPGLGMRIAHVAACLAGWLAADPPCGEAHGDALQRRLQHGVAQRLLAALSGGL